MNSPVVNLDQCDVVKCSNCSKELMFVYPQKADKNITMRMQVGCPWCGDHSYDYEVKGTLKYAFAPNVKFKQYVEEKDRVKFLTVK